MFPVSGLHGRKIFGTSATEVLNKMTQHNKKPRITSQKSKLLSDNENARLFQLIGNRCVVSNTFGNYSTK